MRFKSVISMNEKEREEYFEEKRKEHIKPMLDKLLREDGTLDIEGLAYFLTELADEIDEVSHWRRS